MSRQLQRVVFAGGGTGGHLFPGMAVLDAMQSLGFASQPLFVGTPRGLEAKVVPTRGWPLELLDVRPLSGRSAGQLVRNLARLPTAVIDAMRVLKAHRADLVVGLGGYAAGPVLLAARVLRMPTALMEQNAAIGGTNRVLLRWVGRAYFAMEPLGGLPRGRAVRLMGNPVRQEIAAAGADMHPEKGHRILVLGGSQGAHALNRVVPRALARAGVTAHGLEVVHQTGATDEATVRDAYAALGVQARVHAFITDMAQAYVGTRFAICRSGATTLAELTALGLPAVMVPYPFAAHAHQHTNAAVLVQAGAGVMIDEGQLNEARLADAVMPLLDDDERVGRMARAARRLGKPDAADAIAKDLVQWLA